MSRYLNERGLIKSEAVLKDLVVGVIALIFLAWVWPFHTVATGNRGVVTQFGRIVGVEGEGLVILPPWQRLHTFNVRSEAAEIEKAEGATADQQPVTVSLTVRYAINPQQVSMVFEKFSRDGNLDNYVTTAAQEVFKGVTARYKAPELISKRPDVSNAIRTGLAAKLAQYGAVVTNIDMRDFQFHRDYITAITDKVTQEQKKLAAENRVRTIEAEQKSKVAVAEAEAEAARKRADGEAYATTKAAEANAQALRVQNAALAQNKEVLELRRIEVELEKAKRWNGQLPQAIYGSAPIPFLPAK